MQNLAFGPGNEGREVFWNTVNYQIPLDVFAIIALAIMGWGLYKRSELWRAMGKAEVRDDNRGERFKNLFRNGILQLSVWRDFYPGLIHGLIFFAFFVLIWGAAIDATSFYTGVHLPGKGYLAFSFIMDLFGLFAIVGCILAIDRRYIKKPDRLGYKGTPDNRPEDAIVLGLILAIMVTGYIVEGIRIVATGNSDFEKWSFIGYMVGQFFVGINVDTLKISHKVLWWGHAFLAFGFIAYIPFSRLLHIVTSPANQFMATLKPVGQLEPIRDFENAESFGVGKLEEFTWKQIFDSDACTRCGRCQNGCPAYLTGKELSPKKLVQDIKDHWLTRAPLYAAAAKAAKTAGPDAAAPEIPESEKNLINDAVGVNPVWDCTNCMHCMEHCPVMIEHVPKIVDMRRYKVLTEADFAPELQLTYRNMENNSNPWGIGAHMRGDWAKELGVKTMAENPEAEYLLVRGLRGRPGRPRQEGLGGLREDPAGRGRQLRHPRHRGELLRRFGHEGRQRVPLPGARPGQHRGDERLRGQEGHHHLPPRLQHDQEGLPPAGRHTTRSITTRRSSPISSPRGRSSRRRPPKASSPTTTRASWAATTRSTTSRERSCRPCPASSSWRWRSTTTTASAAAQAAAACGWRSTTASGSTTPAPTWPSR